MLIIQSLGVWIALSIAAILCGIVREKFVTPKYGSQTAHVIGTLFFCGIIFLFTYFFVAHIDIVDHRTLFYIGVFWFFLTIVFEFLFGHFVAGHSWVKLCADYNIFKGRIWILVLLTSLFAPLICGLFL